MLGGFLDQIGSLDFVYVLLIFFAVTYLIQLMSTCVSCWLTFQSYFDALALQRLGLNSYSGAVAKYAFRIEASHFFIQAIFLLMRVPSLDYFADIPRLELIISQLDMQRVSLIYSSLGGLLVALIFLALSFNGLYVRSLVLKTKVK